MPPVKRTRVLCVDDEPNILEGLKVHLGRSFDMLTAVGGEAAIEAIADDGPFAVIVTDMRMPGMNGIQFLQAAKPLAPDTTFIMLTGNHDLETASQAINEGHVFRFLNKPCPSNMLKVAIDDGIERYNLLKEKREVLNDTFVGAIRLMTDVLEMSYPEIFSRAYAVEQIATQLNQLLQIEERWEYKLAVRLCRLGGALLERSTDDLSIEKSTQRWKWEADVGRMMIKHIPRLKLVSEIVGQWGTAAGNFPTIIATDEEVVAAGAGVCRASWFLEYLLRDGHTPTSAAYELSLFMPNASSRLTEAARKIEPPQYTPAKNAKIQALKAEQLKPGMVLAETFKAEDKFELAAGHRLSEAMIYRLVHLTETSASTFQAVIN